MPSTHLTRRRVDAFKPHRNTYDVRDTDLTGFGVRILPSGRKRYFLHSQVKGHRVWHAIGDAGAITLARARSQAGALLALRHSGDETVPVASVMFEAVAEEVFRRYRRHWKSSTLAVNLSYYPGSGASQLPKSRAGSSCSG